ncbi:unnamed protein product [Orchesella dallaii]|uniref:Uncharacterized protein n=1 Tax=Orchesella dallaii TaxID=48710 RepID=A0ABP1RSJ0_9HEXA
MSIASDIIYGSSCPYWVCNCKLVKLSKILGCIAAVVIISTLVWIYGATVFYIALTAVQKLLILVWSSVITALKSLSIIIFIFPGAKKCSDSDKCPTSAIPNLSSLKSEQPTNYDDVVKSKSDPNIPDPEAISAIYKSIEQEIDLIKTEVQNLKIFLNDVHNRLEKVESEVKSNYNQIIQRLDHVELTIEALSAEMSETIINLKKNLFDLEVELESFEKRYGKITSSTVCKHYVNTEYEKEIVYSCSSGECPVGAEAFVMRRKRVVHKCVD